MAKLPLEVITELGEILALALATGVLSALGLRAELLAAESVSAGQLGFGLWLCLLGGVAFYFGLYLLGVTTLVPRLRLLLTRRVG